MAVNYGVASPSSRGYILESKTNQRRQELYPGERYQPVIQEGLRFIAAPYLPFQTSDFVKEFELFRVIERYQLVSVDEQGFVVPANGILKHWDIDDGAPSEWYEGRPLTYGDEDVGTGTYGSLDVDNPPLNLNPFDGAALESGDVNGDGVVTGSAGNPTDGGIAGRTWVGVSGGRFPIGAVTDKVLSSSTIYTHKNYKVQKTLTILTKRTLLVAEQPENRYNYAQATRNAIATRNTLVGAGSVIAGTDLDLAEIPAWAAATGRDFILPGDLVACDDSGNYVRFGAMVENWSLMASEGSPTHQEITGAMPVAAMNAVVGRCHGREKAVSDTGLNLVRTYENHPNVSGTGTSGVEKILTRSTAVTAGELSAFQSQSQPGGIAGATNLEWDVEEDEKYGLLIHLSL